MVTSYANRTSPVLRGKWILENILGAPPPPPPPDVPSFEESEPGTVPTSVRARLEQHRKNPACAVCHARIDPLGFALENFDAVGKWRTKDGAAQIDASGAFPTGEAFSGPTELRGALVGGHREEFVETVVEKLLTYALGRGVGVLRQAGHTRDPAGGQTERGTGGQRSSWVSPRANHSRCGRRTARAHVLTRGEDDDQHQEVCPAADGFARSRVGPGLTVARCDGAGLCATGTGGDPHSSIRGGVHADGNEHGAVDAADGGVVGALAASAVPRAVFGSAHRGERTR